MLKNLRSVGVSVGSFMLLVAMFLGLPVLAAQFSSREDVSVASGSAAGASGDVSVSAESDVLSEPEADEAVADVPDELTECNPNYNPCVENSPHDLDCADIGFSVTVIGNDEYGLDRDKDGTGCES